MPGSLTSYCFQLEVPILLQGRKKNSWCKHDSLMTNMLIGTIAATDLCLQNFSS